ncbi:MAG: hypothetical protein IKA87_00805 [Lentisphaeria bacterium]|nr:hypothetical protein [Lentisphaeria bacterium]
MLNSKFFVLIALLTTLALGGAVALQAMEMQEYNLFNILQQRYFPSK